MDLILKNKPHEINHKVVDVKRAQARGMAPPSIHHGVEVSFRLAFLVMISASACPIDTHISSLSRQLDFHGKDGGAHQSSQSKQGDGTTAASVVVVGGGASASGGGGPSPEELQNKVFVGGLPLHVDRDGLQDFFSCFGPVTDVSNSHHLCC